MFTIVIPTMWKSAFLLKFLYELVHVELVQEIIIINNDHKNTPRDDILFHGKVRMVDFGDNIYVNPAWNYGIKESKTNLVCLMNDDLTYDVRLFSKVKEFTENNNTWGSLGLSPGVEHLSQRVHTSKDINFVQWESGQDLLGYGCLMFVQKNTWRDIPDGLDIYCGDAFIFDRSLWMGLNNYLITDILHEISYATTATSVDADGNKLAEGFLAREGIIYNDIKVNRHRYLSPYINYNSTLVPRRLIIDSFIFFNELAILEGRLEYLFDSVDYFVITESNLSFSGNEKPLHFLLNTERYSKYKRKIIYNPCIVDKNKFNFEKSINDTDYSSDCWKMEKQQRNHITHAIKKFKQHSYVMISDVDEIPSMMAIDYVKQNFASPAVTFLQSFILYNLENMNSEINWHGTIMATSELVLENGSQWVRENIQHFHKIYNSGWHFSYFGGSSKIIEKIENFSHQELNHEQYKNSEKINNTITNGTALFGGTNKLTKVDRNYYPPDVYNIFSNLKF